MRPRFWRVRRKGAANGWPQYLAKIGSFARVLACKSLSDAYKYLSKIISSTFPRVPARMPGDSTSPQSGTPPSPPAIPILLPSIQPTMILPGIGAGSCPPCKSLPSPKAPDASNGVQKKFSSGRATSLCFCPESGTGIGPTRTKDGPRIGSNYGVPWWIPGSKQGCWISLQ